MPRILDTWGVEPAFWLTAAKGTKRLCQCFEHWPSTPGLNQRPGESLKKRTRQSNEKYNAKHNEKYNDCTHEQSEPSDKIGHSNEEFLPW